MQFYCIKLIAQRKVIVNTTLYTNKKNNKISFTYYLSYLANLDIYWKVINKYVILISFILFIYLLG